MTVALWVAAVALTVVYALVTLMSDELAHAIGAGFAVLAVLAWLGLTIDLVLGDLHDRPDR